MTDSSLDTVDGFERNGVKVRRRSTDGFVSVSDLWKAENSPSMLRPDRWLAQQENSVFFESADLDSSWHVVKGGKFQGTFASPVLAARYAMSLSLDCHDWLCQVLDYEPLKGIKATKRDIPLGAITLSVFQLPSGEYRLSQVQVAGAVEKDESSFRDFLASKSPEALPYKGFRSGKLSVEGNNKPINPITIQMATAYWVKESIAKNAIASRLLGACAVETIERRADRAFGIVRAEEERDLRFRSAFEVLIEFFPGVDRIAVPDPVTGSGTSMVLAEQTELKRFQRKYSKEMFRHPKKDVIRDLVMLGAMADWHLTPGKPFSYPSGAANRNAYPDLTSQRFECAAGDHTESVILLFQYVATIADERHVKDCFYLRDYINRVKESSGVDHVLLFLVSPYGVTRYAASEIKDRPELSSCVGVITVKQLASFFFAKASENKNQIRRGRLKREYQHLTEYKTLDQFAEQEECKKLALQSKLVPAAAEQLSLFAS